MCSDALVSTPFQVSAPVCRAFVPNFEDKLKRPFNIYFFLDGLTNCLNSERDGATTEKGREYCIEVFGLKRRLKKRKKFAEKKHNWCIKKMMEERESFARGTNIFCMRRRWRKANVERARYWQFVQNMHKHWSSDIQPKYG